MNDRPSGATAIPSSSVGPDVICSEAASVAPSAFDVPYIHAPSGAHAAKRQAASGGPTWRPRDVPLMGTSRHGIHSPLSVISAMSAHLPSADGYERCAIA